MTAKARKDGPPADDSIEPALMTPRRLAAELERVATDLARLQHRLRRLCSYVDHGSMGKMATDLSWFIDSLGELGGKVLIGQIPIVAGRDEAAGRDRYPLLEQIAATAPAPPAWHDLKTTELDLPDWVSGPLIARGYLKAGQLAPFADQCDPGMEAVFRASWNERQAKRALNQVKKALEKLRARGDNQ